jgi:hypothetical protein
MIGDLNGEVAECHCEDHPPKLFEGWESDLISTQAISPKTVIAPVEQFGLFDTCVCLAPSRGPPGTGDVLFSYEVAVFVRHCSFLI